MTDRSGEKQISMWLPVKLHYNAKVQAVKEGSNLKEYVIKLIEEDLKRKKNNYEIPKNQNNEEKYYDFKEEAIKLLEENNNYFCQESVEVYLKMVKLAKKNFVESFHIEENKNN